MVISYVGDAENSAQNGGDVTVDISGLSLAENDVLIMTSGLGSDSGETSTLSIQDSGWTVLSNTSHDATDRITFLCGRKVMGGTPDSSVTINVTSGDADMGHGVVVRAYRGVDTTTPEDAITTLASGDDAQPDSPLITTLTDNAWVLSLNAKNTSDNAVTVPTGYGNFQQDIGNDLFDATVSGADKTVAVKGIENPDAWSNFNNGGAWIALSVALRESGAGASSAILRRRREVVGVH